MLVIAIPIKSMRRLLWCVMVKQHGMLMEEFRFLFFLSLFSFTILISAIKFEAIVTYKTTQAFGRVGS